MDFSAKASKGQMGAILNEIKDIIIDTQNDIIIDTQNDIIIDTQNDIIIDTQNDIIMLNYIVENLKNKK